MSLTTPRLIGPMTLSLAALVIASCSGQSTPTAPSSTAAAGAVTASAGPSSSPSQTSSVTEYFVTLIDDASVSTTREEPGEAVPPPPSGSAPSPWPPGPPPLAAPGVPMPTPPSIHFRVRLKVDPEPVPHSGIPVPIFGCRDNRYTWYYDQYIHAETGVGVTLTERENFFDGRFTSSNGEVIQLTGNGSAILHTRWCSGVAKPHYTQTRFKGRDEYGEPITISGPWVRLLTP